MHFIAEHTTQILEVKQSKFIAHLLPYELYTTTLETLKEQHPKARHFVTAYRYLNEFDQVVEHSSDDGEPKGTSGKPSLMVLQGRELINTAVIVVRYFGGTKLGTGGLVRAYSDAVNLVVEGASLLEYKKEITQKLHVAYGDDRFVTYTCEQYGITIIEKKFDAEIRYTIRADEQSMEQFLKQIKNVVKIVS